MTKEQAIAKLKEAQGCGDIEVDHCTADHCTADQVLCDFLTTLGWMGNESA